MFVRAFAATAVFGAVAAGAALGAPALATPASPTTTRPAAPTTPTTQRRSSTTSSGATATTTPTTRRSTSSTATTTNYRVTLKATTSALNLRPDAGTAKAPIDHLVAGTIVHPTGKTTKVGGVLWRQVTLGHETGWVNSTYLTPTRH
jgi:hypothetical protein